MSFGGLILTNGGRNKMAAAISEKNALQFTHIQLGDGAFNGSYSSKSELTHMVMEIPITHVQRNNNEVLIECDWNSKQAPTPFYLREIGIIGNGVLCYYDNGRDGDAEYIDPESEAVVKQKRFRFTVSITDDVEIAVTISSGLYALAEDVETEITELKKSVSDGKSAVASAITGMGVSTATDDTFETMAGNIEKIKPTINVGGSTSAGVWNGATFTYGQGGGGGSASINGKNTVSSAYSLSPRTTTVGGNAATSDVLSGKTFSSNNAGREVNGTMPNHGAYTYDMWSKYSISGVDQNLKVTIPSGYHNGNGYVQFPENTQSHALRAHTFGGSSNYIYLTINAENGYYYSFHANVNGISSSQCVFIVCYRDGNCTSVMDIIPVLKSDGVTKYTSQSGDYRAWGDRNQYHIEKIASNKYPSGTWMAAQILTMVSQS